MLLAVRQGGFAVSDTRNVGIFIFPDVEVLDFCGPYEVFSVAGRQVAPGSFARVYGRTTRGAARGA